jgi:predicted translin family RNA/ssDNA-binding protein
MVDSAVFAKLKAAMDSFDEKRDRIIRESRDILTNSKHAIYSIHRDELAAAKEQLAAAKAVKTKLEALIGDDAGLRTGGFSSACEEYVEAAALLSYVTNGAFPTPEDLGVSGEEYLLGLADLTGELTRRAVLAATKQQRDEVARIHKLLEAIYGEFVKFDFRNGELRRKYDSIKYSLQKVEQVLYDLSLRR